MSGVVIKGDCTEHHRPASGLLDVVVDFQGFHELAGLIGRYSRSYATSGNSVAILGKEQAIRSGDGVEIAMLPGCKCKGACNHDARRVARSNCVNPPESCLWITSSNPARARLAASTAGVGKYATLFGR